MGNPKHKPTRPLDMAFDDSGVKANAKLVFLIMCRRGNRTGECYMSNNRLAEECGVSVSTVSRAKRELRKLKRILPIRRRAGSATWSYSLHPQQQSDLASRSIRPEDPRQNDLQNPKLNQKENPGEPVGRLRTSERRHGSAPIGAIAEDISRRTRLS